MSLRDGTDTPPSSRRGVRFASLRNAADRLDVFVTLEVIRVAPAPVNGAGSRRGNCPTRRE
jgi:hypothetical protein